MEHEVKKFRWLVLIVVVLACLVLWAQVINIMCDQDVQFFSGICAINKFILVILFLHLLISFRCGGGRMLRLQRGVK